MRPLVLSGRYELLEHVGQGSTASVWRALDQHLQQTVAVKLLSPTLASDADARARFTVEAERAASLRDAKHPEIVVVYDFDEDYVGGESTPYLVMEFLAGGSLGRRIHGGTLDISGVIDMGISVLLGLVPIHARNWWHGDIKPGNIMFDSSGRLRIVDFGISRVVGDHIRTDGLALATARYVSPEQIRDFDRLVREGQGGGVPSFDGRLSDIYSLGAVMFESLTSEPLYDAPTSRDLQRLHLLGTPRDPCAMDPRIPEALGQVVLKALSRTDRYLSATPMLNHLEEIRDKVALGLAASDAPTHLGQTSGKTGQAVDLPPRAAFDSIAFADPGQAKRKAPHPTRGVASADPPASSRAEVSAWLDNWYRALQDGCDTAQGFLRIPDRLVVSLPTEHEEPPQGWDRFLRAVDKPAARRLRTRLQGGGAGFAVFPPLTIMVLQTPTLTTPTIRAWCSGTRDPGRAIGDPIWTVEIPEEQRLSLDLAVLAPRGRLWRPLHSAPIHREFTFGSQDGADLVYSGPARGRIAGLALTVTDIQEHRREGPTVVMRVLNPAGCICRGMPPNLVARLLGWRRPVRTVDQGGTIRLELGDRLTFPGAEQHLWLEFT